MAAIKVLWEKAEGPAHGKVPEVTDYKRCLELPWSELSKQGKPRVRG
jgi:hypothetical protein